MTPSPNEVTQLLVAWGNGDRAARDELMPLVYDELRRLAHRYMDRERPDHTLQTSALVNEAYLRLIDQKDVHSALQLCLVTRWQTTCACTRDTDQRCDPD